MKIRTDFVTNSSSSSFIMVLVDNPVLQEILKKHAPLDVDDEMEVLYGLEFDGDITKISLGDWEDDEDAYKTFDDLVNALVDILTWVSPDASDRVGKELVEEVNKRKDEWMKTFRSASVAGGDVDWGEFDARYDRSNYSDEYLAKVYEDIAKKLGKDPKDVTDDEFCEYVDRLESYKGWQKKYNFEKGEFEKPEDFFTL